jgi:hypothetical protein
MLGKVPINLDAIRKSKLMEKFLKEEEDQKEKSSRKNSI